MSAAMNVDVLEVDRRHQRDALLAGRDLAAQDQVDLVDVGAEEQEGGQGADAIA